MTRPTPIDAARRTRQPDELAGWRRTLHRREPSPWLAVLLILVLGALLLARLGGLLP